MKNLFICHSQSHLILSAGLSKGRFVEDENHLILFNMSYKILLTVSNLLLCIFYVRIILLKDVFIIAKVNQKDYYIKVCFFVVL